jgi:hypothetical protein
MARTRNIITVGVVCAVISGFVLGRTVNRDDGHIIPATADEHHANGVHLLRADFDRLEHILEVSELVVEARFSGEREIAVAVPSVDGGPPISRTDLVRTFVVSDVLRGDSPGARIDVRSTLSRSVPGFPGPLEQVAGSTVVPLEQGKTYVLFLAHLQDIDGPIWASLAEPGVAEVVGDELRFIGSDQHAAAIRGRSPSVGDARVAPALERVPRATLDQALGLLPQ